MKFGFNAMFTNFVETGRASLSMSRSGFLVAFMVIWSACYGNAEVYPSIHWTPQNPIFSENKNELRVFQNNKINVVCPNPSTVLTRMKDQTSKDNLFENLWSVDRTSYDTCSTKKTGRLLLSCDTPLTLKYSTLVFRRHQPDTNDLEFIPGKEYFFIATSNGTKTSLHSTSGGHCSSHNMKYKVYVCKDEHDKFCLKDQTRQGSSSQKRSPYAPQEKSVEKNDDNRNHFEVDTTERTQIENQTEIENNNRAENCERSKIPVVAMPILLSVVIVSIILNALLIWRHFTHSGNRKQLPVPNKIPDATIDL